MIEDATVLLFNLVENLDLIVNVETDSLSELLYLVNDLTGHTLLLEIVIEEHVKHDRHIEGGVHTKGLVLGILLVKLL